MFGHNSVAQLNLTNIEVFGEKNLVILCLDHHHPGIDAISP
jgi:hypothetical protein